MKTFILLDQLLSCHAHIKAQSRTEAMAIYFRIKEKDLRPRHHEIVNAYYAEELKTLKKNIKLLRV